jgi:hypothetical protein
MEGEQSVYTNHAAGPNQRFESNLSTLITQGGLAFGDKAESRSFQAENAEV